jgi:uncharacterized protein YhbP (UPF0306 family)
MIVIHDLYLEHDGLTAQIDYLIVLRHVNLVLECKNLYGDIAIDADGNFVRTMAYGGRRHQEGVYSPITQLQRHMDLVRTIGADAKSNAILRTSFKHYFDDSHKSLVVLANPKTILHAAKAKRAITEKVVRCDALVARIKGLEKESRLDAATDREMRASAQRWVDRNSENQVDYLKRYETALQGCVVAPQPKLEKPVTASATTRDAALYEALRTYRNKRTREDGVKPYVLCNNKELEGLVARRPQTISQLQEVRGFGEKKCALYGEEIIAIVRRFPDS